MATLSSQMALRLVIHCRLCTPNQLSRMARQRRFVIPQTWSVHKQLLSISALSSAGALPGPQSDGSHKEYPKHVVDIVDSISRLTLLDVANLNELLKNRLKIADAPMMSMGSMMASGMIQPSAAKEAEPEPPKEVQTEFLVKLIKFDEKAKVKLIKEIKAIMTDMNLVQAKKFVESVPQVVKEKLTKENAEKLKVQLESAGAVVEVE